MSETYYVTGRPERTYLVGVDYQHGSNLWTIEDSLEELAQLARTAGMVVAGSTYQRLDHPDPATYIGSGKVEEIKASVAATGSETVIFDEELSPAQQKNLENQFGEEVKVLDRTVLILDIFAQHAHTKEGQLQVELAQYEYRLPRLTRMWTHLARQAGGRAGGDTGGVGLRGPGETQLEVDRREIGRKIARLKREIEEVRTHRKQHRRRRKRSGIPVVSIVGYTNAGKSTLLNAISDASVSVEDQLFATLDPTTRRVQLPEGREVLFTDTVGFIQRLPHDLVAAFRATLEEVQEADLLLHVVDITHEMAEAQMETVEEVLEELGVAHKTVVVAWNKIDLADERERWRELAARQPNTVAISAKTGQGIENLLGRIEQILKDMLVEIELEVPYTDGDLLHEIYEQGIVEAEDHGPNGTLVHAFVPVSLANRLNGGQHI